MRRAWPLTAPKTAGPPTRSERALLPGLAPKTTRSDNARGIVLMLLATGVLTFMDATMKRLSEDYAPLEVAALRGAVSLPFVVGWVLYRERGLGTLFRVRWGLELLRGALALIMLTCLVIGLREAPISEVYTLFFVAPLLITLLSVRLLAEAVDAGRWMAIAVGFSGALIVLRPGFTEARLGAVATLIGAGCYALNAITVRILGRTDSSAAMTFWFMAVVTVGASLLAMPDWTPVRAESAAWLLTLGLTGALGQGLLTEAFRRAPASVVAPFEYFALFWALGLDLLGWGKLPEPVVLLGASIIVGSGIYLMKREQRPSVAPHPMRSPGERPSLVPERAATKPRPSPTFMTSPTRRASSVMGKDATKPGAGLGLVASGRGRRATQ